MIRREGTAGRPRMSRSPRSSWTVGLAARAVVLVLLTVVTAGCYTYRTVEAPPLGSIVRVRVPVGNPLNNPNRAPETASIEGRLLTDGDTIRLATETRREFGAYREIVQFDTIQLARSQTSAVEVREFSTGRSVILGVVIAGGAGTAAAIAFGLGGGKEGEPPGGGGPEPAIVFSGSLLASLWGWVFR